MQEFVHPVPTETRLSLGMVAAFAGIYVIWGTTYLAIAFAVRSMPPFISGGARFTLAGLLMYAWLRWRNPRPFAGTNVTMMALVRRAALRRRQWLRRLGAAGHPQRHCSAHRRVRAGARVDFRLGVLQQASADQAGLVRHRRGNRRRGDDRDAYPDAIRQRAAHLRARDAARRPLAGASARCCRNAGRIPARCSASPAGRCCSAQRSSC